MVFDGLTQDGAGTHGDGNSVVDFGDLGTSHWEGCGGEFTFGCEIPRYKYRDFDGDGQLDRTDIVEPDMRFRSDVAPRRWWYRVTRPPRPSNYLDLFSFATHESGHSIGLHHPGKHYGPLVMYAKVSSPGVSDRRLGKGDVLGMRALYRNFTP